MRNVNHIVRIVIVFAALTAFTSANGAELKFHAAPGAEPVIGRYLVTIDGSIAADVVHDSAEALARAYGGQLEPYSSSNTRQFAIAMLPSRARTLSTDPRVREVVEVAHSEAVDALSPNGGAPPSASTLARHLTPSMLDSSSSGTYVYDGAGNITTIGADSFVYDLDGRLTQATVQGSQQSYTYDAYGNRNGASRAAGAASCVGGCEAMVTVLPATNHLAEQTYYDDGSVKTGYGATYTYDGTGMVMSATVGSDIRIFVYTADDERIAVRRGSSWTWTVRDQSNKVLREFTSLETTPSPLNLTTHTWSKDYVWRDGQLLASLSGSPTPTTYHYHLDHLGTPRLITGTGGSLVAKHTYYPFGAEMTLTPPENSVELMKFTGHERDIVAADNASVDYMHARMYNGNLGRFLAVDPDLDLENVIHEPQVWNRYAYVTNNPLRYVDPNGQDRWDVANGYFNSLFSDFGLTIRVEQNNASATGGIVTSPSGVGAIVGGVGVVVGVYAMTNAGIHLAQDSNPTSGGGNEAKPKSEAAPKLEATPTTKKDAFGPLRGRDAKVNKVTGEIWAKDRFHKDHWEVYKNQKAFDNGERVRSVWDDGRLKEKF